MKGFRSGMVLPPDSRKTLLHGALGVAPGRICTLIETILWQKLQTHSHPEAPRKCGRRIVSMFGLTVDE